MGIFRTRPRPVRHLRRDASTPHGTIWSCFATPEEEKALEEPAVVDDQHLLHTGDIVNVKPMRSRHRFTVRVNSRCDDVVAISKIRG